MSKPWIHALSSAKKFGGRPEDYLELHNLLDLSKGAVADSRHRVLTHNAFFIGVILERIPFHNSAPPVGGLYTTIINSDGKHISVRDIGEQHCLEDFHGFIPTLQDYTDHMEMTPWMNNGQGQPNSVSRMKKGGSFKTTTKFVPFDEEEKKNLEDIKKALESKINEKPSDPMDPYKETPFEEVKRPPQNIELASEDFYEPQKPNYMDVRFNERSKYTID